MRLYIDSALTSDWDLWAKRGAIFGATTNPLIFQKQGVDLSRRSLFKMIDKAKDLGLKSLQIQVDGFDASKEAARLFNRLFDRWPEGVVAKVPLTAEGLSVMPHLNSDAPLTMTAVYDVPQAVLAAAQGARYVAPYYGRIKEAGKDADAIVDNCLKICQPQTRVLLASLRSAEQVIALAARGHDTFTLSPAVMDELLISQPAQEATASFEAAAKELREQANKNGSILGFS